MTYSIDEQATIIDSYYEKFGDGLPTYGQSEEGMQELMKMAIDAIDGKRGIITYEDLGYDSSVDV